MKTHPLHRAARALTLIELIGVLAILAILAAILIPSVVRQLDQVAGDKESEQLKAISGALQRSIVRNRYIPSHGDWASVAAAELGVAPQSVAVNGRSQPRYFLIDPSFQVGTNGAGLPFAQSNWIAGSTVKSGSLTIPPISPRAMILSSTGTPLTNIVSGVASATNFNAIWNSTNSAGTPFAYARDDLRVQRLHFAPLFVHLILTTNNSSTNLARYSISVSARDSRTNTVPSSPWIDGYFITGSVLNLYATNGTWFDSSQIINRDSSFIYDESVWRNSLIGPPPGAGGGALGIFPSAYSIVTNFLAAPANTGTGAPTQLQVVQAMIDYMNAYDAWAGSPTFPNNNAQYDTAYQKYTNMVAYVNRLCCNPIPPQGP